MTTPSAIPTSRLSKSQPIPLSPRELGNKDWGHEWLLAQTLLYTLKRLDMNAGFSGPLQYHETKHETFVVHSGLVEVFYVDEDGHLTSQRIGPGEGFTIPPYTVHKVAAIRDTVMYESSNPIFDDRVNVEHLYASPEREEAHRRK